MHLLSRVAADLGKRARIAIRVNPDVDAKTHAKISTGKSENKFGVPYTDALSLYDEAAGLPGIDVTGEMYNQSCTCYVRIPFTLTAHDLADASALTLMVRL